MTHGWWPTRLLCLCNSPGKNNGVSSHSLLQAIFMTQGSNLHLFHRRQIISCLSHQTLVSRLRVPGCVGTGAAERSYPTSEVRGMGKWSYPKPEVMAATIRSNPMSKEQQLRGCRRAERSYSTFKVRRHGHEEIPLVQGKEQRLHFAGAAVKRYPTSRVRETQVRW